MAIQTVLFDLDGTLLPMDQNVFVKSYLGRIARAMAVHGYDPDKLVKAIWSGTDAMVRNDGSRLNEAVFWDTFAGFFGAPTPQELALFDAFYREGFPAVQESCGFTPRAKEVLDKVKALGLQAVLATNPIFPAAATHQRVQWAGLQTSDFLHITTYENASFCKPNPDYYREILHKLGLAPEECLMVGNDVGEDMCVTEMGMEAFWLDTWPLNRKDLPTDHLRRGGFDELLRLIDGLPAVDA